MGLPLIVSRFMRKEVSNRRKLAEGISAGLVTYLAFEVVRKARSTIIKNWDEIEAFSESVEASIQKARQQGVVDELNIPIELGHLYMNAGAAVYLRNPSDEGRLDITSSFEAYGVFQATARPLDRHPDVYVRRFLVKRLREANIFDIVGKGRVFTIPPTNLFRSRH